MSEADLRLNIKRLRQFSIVFYLIFFTPVFIIYLKDKFSISEAIILQMAYVIASVIFEVPTGIFADKFGKKLSIVVGAGLMSVIIFLFGVVDNFWAFALLEASGGVAISFLSGSNSALLYETLKQLKQEDKFKKINGQINQYTLISIAVANIIGGFIAKIGVQYTFKATAITAFLGMLIATQLKEPYLKKAKEKSYIKEAFKELILRDRELRFVLVISLIIYLFNQVLFNIYQPYFLVSGIDIAYFGVIFASFQIVAAFGSKYAYLFEQKIGFIKGLWVLLAIVIVSIFLLGNIVAIYSFVFIYLQQIVRGIRPVLVSDFINKRVSSEYRATILSLQSLIASIAYVPLMSLLSFLSGHYKIAQTINIMGLVAVIFTIIAVIGSLISQKRRRECIA
jgi:MFS family permease